MADAEAGHEAKATGGGSGPGSCWDALLGAEGGEGDRLLAVDTKLWRCNIAAGVMAAILCIGAFASGINGEVPVFWDAPDVDFFRNANNTGWLAFPVVIEKEPAAHLDVALLMGAFTLVTTLGHASAGYLLHRARSSGGKVSLTRLNAVRWCEYAISATIMKLSINLLCGVRIVPTLWSDACATVAIMLCGFATEFERRPAIASTIVAWILTTVSWLVTISTFVRAAGGDNFSPPDFVLAIIIVEGILFNTFGIVHAWDLFYKNGADPAGTALRYITLSLGAKSALVVLVLGGLAPGQ